MNKKAHWIVFAVRVIAVLSMLLGTVWVAAMAFKAAIVEDKYDPGIFPEFIFAFGAAIAGMLLWAAFSDRNVRRDRRHQICQTGKPAHHRIWD